MSRFFLTSGGESSIKHVETPKYKRKEYDAYKTNVINQLIALGVSQEQAELSIIDMKGLVVTGFKSKIKEPEVVKQVHAKITLHYSKQV